VEQLENEKEAYYMKEYGADYKKLIDALESGAFEEKPPTYDEIAQARSELIRNDPRTKAAKEQTRFDKEEKRKKIARQTFKKHGEKVPDRLKSN
jgi:collagenase-like PrtC family protease